MIKQDVLGYRYDDDVPAFLNAGPEFYWHRITRKMYGKTAFDAWLAKTGKTFGTKENGNASAAYIANTLGVAFTVGAPVVVPPALTGITAGTPGTFAPTGAVVPVDLTTLQGLGALGNTTAWTVGQYVTLGDTSKAYWNGAAWVTGVVPAPVVPAAPVPGTFTGWTGVGAAPGGMSPNQVGVWADVSAKLDLSTFPLMLAAPVSFTITDQNSKTYTLTLPAATYDALMSPSPPPGTLDPTAWVNANATGTYILDTLNAAFPADTFAGSFTAVKGGKSYLRIDGFPTHANAVAEYTAAGAPAPAAALGTVYPVSLT